MLRTIIRGFGNTIDFCKFYFQTVFVGCLVSSWSNFVFKSLKLKNIVYGKKGEPFLLYFLIFLYTLLVKLLGEKYASKVKNFCFLLVTNSHVFAATVVFSFICSMLFRYVLVCFYPERWSAFILFFWVTLATSIFAICVRYFRSSVLCSDITRLRQESIEYWNWLAEKNSGVDIGRMRSHPTWSVFFFATILPFCDSEEVLPLAIIVLCFVLRSLIDLVYLIYLIWKTPHPSKIIVSSAAHTSTQLVPRGVLSTQIVRGGRWQTFVNKVSYFQSTPTGKTILLVGKGAGVVLTSAMALDSGVSRFNGNVSVISQFGDNFRLGISAKSHEGRTALHKLVACGEDLSDFMDENGSFNEAKAIAYCENYNQEASFTKLREYIESEQTSFRTEVRQEQQQFKEGLLKELIAREANIGAEMRRLSVREAELMEREALVVELEARFKNPVQEVDKQ